MGRYDLVVAEDEPAVWEEDELGKVTHILLVSFISFIFKKWLKEKDQEVEVKKYDRKGKKKAPPSPSKASPKQKKHDERDKTLVKRRHKTTKKAMDSDEEEA